ncbi:MAG: helix-turn-helix domain-containing protein [Dialister sp.]|nr:helix-turn-helix domain-containing protein [Dialister sp.]
MSLETLIQFAVKLGVSLDFLMGLTDELAPYTSASNSVLLERADTSRVREMRLEQGITGKAMAEQLEVSGGAYSTKELHPEVLSFTVEDLIRIAYLFNTSLDYLFRLTDDPFPHARGSHKKVNMKINQRIAMKYRLGLTKSPAYALEEVQDYCREHFNIKKIRLERGLMQVEVAEVLGLNLCTYGMWERNPHRIPVYYLIRLADFYHVSLDYLVGRVDHDG